MNSPVFIPKGDRLALARTITRIENGESLSMNGPRLVPVVGITGGAGVGKSTLISRLIPYYRSKGMKVAVLAIDPSSPLTGGAVLGDRIRMRNTEMDDGVFIRSIAARNMREGLGEKIIPILKAFECYGSDIIFLETIGTGQDETRIVHYADLVLMLLTPDEGDEIQLLKAGKVEIGDILVVNKCDRPHFHRYFQQLRELFSSAKKNVTLAATDSKAGNCTELFTALDACLDNLKPREKGLRGTTYPRAVQCIDHVAVACESIDKILPVFTEILGFQKGTHEVVESENVRVQFLNAGETHLELLETLRADGPIGKYIEKRGAGLHHIALSVNGLEHIITRLQKKGIRLLGDIRRGAEGKKIVFLHPSDTGRVLVELSE